MNTSQLKAVISIKVRENDIEGLQRLLMQTPRRQHNTQRILMEAIDKVQQSAMRSAEV